jgi:hypothetical protein
VPLRTAPTCSASAPQRRSRAHLVAGTPERGEELLVPFSVAAERARWHEAAASAALVTGICRRASGERDDAGDLLARAAELAHRHELPGIEWEALAELALLADGEESERLRAESREIAERLAGDVGDERLAAGLLRAVES